MGYELRGHGLHYGAKAKKRFEIDDVEAGLVRVMFLLATVGDGLDPMGHGIAKWLNILRHMLRGAKLQIGAKVGTLPDRLQAVGKAVENLSQ